MQIKNLKNKDYVDDKLVGFEVHFDNTPTYNFTGAEKDIIKLCYTKVDVMPETWRVIAIIPDYANGIGSYDTEVGTIYFKMPKQDMPVNIIVAYGLSNYQHMLCERIQRLQSFEMLIADTIKDC